MKDKFGRYCFLGLASVLFLCALDSHPKEAKPKFDENKILADFAKVYSVKNKPRITISVNRELGAEFSEYKVASRTQGEVTGKLQVGGKERTMPAKDGTGADIVPRNLLPGKTAAEAKRDYNAQAKAKGKDQEKSAAGKPEEKAGATPEAEAKPEPGAEETKSGAGESKEPAPAKTEAAETKPSGDKKAETAEPSPTQAKPGEASPETAKAPEPDVGKDVKPTGTGAESKAEKPGAAAAGKDEKKSEAKTEAEKPGAAAAGKEEKKIEPEAADKKPALVESKADQGKSGTTIAEDAKEEAGASKEDVADAELEDEEEDYEDVADEDLDDEEAADEESGDTVAVGMKFESVEIRSELPSAERESFFSEGMLWKFQNAFMAPFLEAKVKIVDRATIVRQAGLEELKGKSTKDIDRVAIEMNALNKYTDVYLEILIAKDLNSGSGYVFKADAKDLKSGELIAYATHEGMVKEETKNVIVNPATGKSVKKKMKSLDAEATARSIALLLMQGMTNSWSE